MYDSISLADSSDTFWATLTQCRYFSFFLGGQTLAQLEEMTIFAVSLKLGDNRIRGGVSAPAIAKV